MNVFDRVESSENDLHSLFILSVIPLLFSKSIWFISLILAVVVVVCGVAGDAVGGGRLLPWLTGEAGCKCSVVVRDISFASAAPFFYPVPVTPLFTITSVLNVKWRYISVYHQNRTHYIGKLAVSVL